MSLSTTYNTNIEGNTPEHYIFTHINAYNPKMSGMLYLIKNNTVTATEKSLLLECRESNGNIHKLKVIFPEKLQKDTSIGSTILPTKKITKKPDCDYRLNHNCNRLEISRELANEIENEYYVTLNGNKYIDTTIYGIFLEPGLINNIVYDPEFIVKLLLYINEFMDYKKYMAAEFTLNRTNVFNSNELVKSNILPKIDFYNYSVCELLLFEGLVYGVNRFERLAYYGYPFNNVKAAQGIKEYNHNAIDFKESYMFKASKLKTHTQKKTIEKWHKSNRTRLTHKLLSPKSKTHVKDNFSIRVLDPKHPEGQQPIDYHNKIYDTIKNRLKLLTTPVTKLASGSVKNIADTYKNKYLYSDDVQLSEKYIKSLRNLSYPKFVETIKAWDPLLDKNEAGLENVIKNDSEYNKLLTEYNSNISNKPKYSVEILKPKLEKKKAEITEKYNSVDAKAEAVRDVKIKKLYADIKKPSLQHQFIGKYINEIVEKYQIFPEHTNDYLDEKIAKTEPEEVRLLTIQKQFMVVCDQWRQINPKLYDKYSATHGKFTTIFDLLQYVYSYNDVQFLGTQIPTETQKTSVILAMNIFTDFLDGIFRYYLDLLYVNYVIPPHTDKINSLIREWPQPELIRGHKVDYYPTII